MTAGKRDLVPALADREAAVVEIAAGAGFGEADQRHRLRRRRCDSVDQRHEGLDLVLVAASALATDSVEGQRARPSGVMRFDLLKVVGSRPGLLGQPRRRQARRARRAGRGRSRSGVCVSGALAIPVSRLPG